MTVRLLYIDDDPAFGRLVQKRMERLGYAVTLASEGTDGLARVAAGDADAVALDHYMPGQDGLVTLTGIMALSDPPPVIYVTGTNESRVAVAALKAGAADYVVKDGDGEFIEFLDVALRAALAGVTLRRERDAAHREMSEARHRFEALAHERQMLLREVNHRVGNSLQLVAAFLHLQSASADPANKTALSEANRRVMAVAHVHRRLYESDDVQSVALAPYLQGLVDDLKDASDGGTIGCELSLTADDVTVDPDRAVAIGVIVTELVINAMKYAYPNGSGPIRVTLLAGPDGIVRLAVEDDGQGLGDAPLATRRGIGRTIIDSMAGKLDATVTYTVGHPGTRAMMQFTKPARVAPFRDPLSVP